MVKKTSTTICKKWNTATSFFLRLLPCSCCISLLVASSTNASPIHIQAETFQSSILKPEPSILSQNLQKLLVIDTTKGKSPLLIINFNDMRKQNTFEVSKKYLTFYKGKKEKLNATYIHGAYALNYTQKW